MQYKHQCDIKGAVGDLLYDEWANDACHMAELEQLRAKALKTRPRIPYTLELECSSSWSPFYLEFISYSLGILDEYNMNLIDTDNDCFMKAFWTEVFNREPINLVEADDYELLQEFLFETFRTDFRELDFTFYKVIDLMTKRNDKHTLIIQLAKPLNPYWENIIIPRMKNFFDAKMCDWVTKPTELLNIKLLDNKNNIIKNY